MKLYAKRLFSIFILVACMSLLYRSNLLFKNEKKFLCREVSEGYEVVLFGKWNEEIFSEIYPKEPGIANITDDILEISVSTGNPSRYVFYFDQKTSRISDTFFNPILFDNKYVAYMENDRLVLTDIFGEGTLYKEILRDFSKMANPVSAVISIERMESGDILLRYYAEEDMGIVSETIPH